MKIVYEHEDDIKIEHGIVDAYTSLDVVHFRCDDGRLLDIPTTNVIYSVKEKESLITYADVTKQRKRITI